MSLVFNYQPTLPHSLSWAAGYPLGMSCRDYYLTWFKGGHQKGPIEGELITLKNLPCHGDNYLRFWAAKPKTSSWSNFQQAYGEQDQTEKEPPVDYPNGGMLKIKKNGRVKFRLILPAGYQSKNGYISPHFHYRLCQDGQMGPVQTVFLRRGHHKPCPLMVMRGNLAENHPQLSAYQQRLYGGGQTHHQGQGQDQDKFLEGKSRGTVCVNNQNGKGKGKGNKNKKSCPCKKKNPKPPSKGQPNFQDYLHNLPKEYTNIAAFVPEGLLKKLSEPISGAVMGAPYTYQHFL